MSPENQEKKDIPNYNQLFQQKKEAHVKETEEKLKTLKSKINYTLLEEKGVNKEDFNKKLEELCAKWVGVYSPISDSEGRRIVNAVIDPDAINTPLAFAIIGNSITYLKSICDSESKLEPSAKYWLSFACICGAEKLADYLKNVYKLNLDQDIVAYAISSDNKDFAIKIATEAKEHGVTSCPLAFFYAGRKSIAVAVQSLFSNTSETESDYKLR